MNRLTLDIHFAQRSAELIKRCHQFLSEIAGGASGTGEVLSTLADNIESHLKTCEDDASMRTWRVMASSSRALACHLDTRKNAHDGGVGLSDLRERLAVLLHEARETVAGLPAGSIREALLSAIGMGDEIADTKQLVQNLQVLQLPVTYLMKKDDIFGPHVMSEPAAPVREPSVIKVIAFLDGTPLVSPQLVRQDSLYTLKFCVRGEAWPLDATRLSLDLLTTCPVATYDVSPFIFPRPPQLEQYESELGGQIIFKASQSVLSDNLVFKVRCAFTGEKCGNIQVSTIGHTEVQFRVDSVDNALLASGNPSMDLRISELIRDLVKQCPAAQHELKELVPMLEALAALLGTCAQSGVFKGVTNLSEADFQRMAILHLRMRLGQDLQEHSHQAGGITDLRFRGVVTELKVEDKNGDRNAIARNYCPQLTQYEGVEARQVGVALILDLTAKVLPAGDIRNDIMLVDVPTHGGADIQKKYPSKAFVFVINGNTVNPSLYSA